VLCNGKESQISPRPFFREITRNLTLNSQMTQCTLSGIVIPRDFIFAQKGDRPDQFNRKRSSE
jgi:hypothetical protein